MAVAAHQDDLEILGYHGILSCYESQDKSFFGVVVTDGAGSARSGSYAGISDEKIKELRRIEQEAAAAIGKYGALVQLGVSSSQAKDPANMDLVHELAEWIRLARPEVLYTHNLADKHETHVAIVVKVLLAIRSLPKSERPARVLGCEVWGDLDWLDDAEKVCLDVGGNSDLAIRLLNAFPSQIEGGKRYDLATIARRKTNATYLDPHNVDQATDVIYAMDLTPLILDEGHSIESYVETSIKRFQMSVHNRIVRNLPH
jgi:LmbE family N-acetylglucosaminyl deacetylase